MIRLENLKLILRQRQWGAHELSQATVGPDGKPKWSRSHCADLLAERKSFGEKAARYLEEQVLLIPRFWLDQPHHSIRQRSRFSLRNQNNHHLVLTVVTVW